MEHSKKCLQCCKSMTKVVFGIGHNVTVSGFNCEECGFNITEESYLKKCVKVMGYYK